MHAASLGRRDGLISVQVTISSSTPSRYTQICSMYFLLRIYIQTAKSNRAVKRIGEGVRCVDLTICLIVTDNSMCARKQQISPLS